MKLIPIPFGLPAHGRSQGFSQAVYQVASPYRNNDMRLAKTPAVCFASDSKYHKLGKAVAFIAALGLLQGGDILLNTWMAGDVVDRKVVQYQKRQDDAERLKSAEINALKSKISGLSNQVTSGDEDDAIRELTRSVVEVMTPPDKAGNYFLGTGTYIRFKNGVTGFLTNAHVLEGEDKTLDTQAVFKLRPYHQDKKIKARIMKVDGKPVYSASNTKGKDLAVLIPVGNTIPKGLVPLPIEKLRDVLQAPIHVGERVVLVGNPDGEGDNVTLGRITNDKIHTSLNPMDLFIRVDAAGYHGCSGGPVATIRKVNGSRVTELSGVYTLGPENDGEDRGEAIRADSIRAFLRRFKLVAATPQKPV